MAECVKCSGSLLLITYVYLADLVLCTRGDVIQAVFTLTTPAYELVCWRANKKGLKAVRGGR